MSSSRGLLGRVTGALGVVTDDRVLWGLLIVGVSGSVLFLLLTGMLPLYGFGEPLYTVALAVPFVGVALAIAAAVSLLRSSDPATGADFVDAIPDAEQVDTDERVGEAVRETLHRARRARYSGSTTDGSETVHTLLVDTVERTLRTQEGKDGPGAERAVAEGSWTDDRVAAAFLSARRRLPLLERLRGAVDPGRAYRRRLDRTLDAIDRLEGEGTDTGTDHGLTDGDGSRTQTVFEGQLPGGSNEQGGSSLGLAVTLLLLGVGVAAARPILVVGATLGLWYVGAGAVAGPTRGSLELTRQLSTASGDPGDLVSVELRVENTGEAALSDLRLVDGVPSELSVRSGSPRACVSLGPGEETVLSYELELSRGEFTFGPVTLRTVDLTGQVAHSQTVGEGSQSLRCLPAVDRLPLGDATNNYAGTVAADEGGRGVEFYSVREYERGDPVSAIDWRRYAHTRDLATVEHRVERSTRVVCLVDCRESQQRPATDGRLPALDISVAAARRTVDSLLETGYPTGLVMLGDTVTRQVEPGTSAEKRTAMGELLDREFDDETTDIARSRRFARPAVTLPGALPGEAQVFLFSSLVDDLPVELVTRLRSEGFTVTVISPDVTAGAGETPLRLAGLRRDERVLRARANCARVVDWDAGRPLGTVLGEAIRGVHSA